MRNLWGVAVREGVLKKVKKDFLEMLVLTTALAIILRYGAADVPQADDVAYDISFIFLLSSGVSLARGVMEMVAVRVRGGFIKEE